MDVPAELGAVSCQLLLLSASSRARELCGSLETAPTPLMVWVFRVEGSGVRGSGVPASVGQCHASQVWFWVACN